MYKKIMRGKTRWAQLISQQFEATKMIMSARTSLINVSFLWRALHSSQSVILRLRGRLQSHASMPPSFYSSCFLTLPGSLQETMELRTWEFQGSKHQLKHPNFCKLHSRCKGIGFTFTKASLTLILLEKKPSQYKTKK